MLSLTGGRFLVNEANISGWNASGGYGKWVWKRGYAEYPRPNCHEQMMGKQGTKSTAGIDVL